MKKIETSYENSEFQPADPILETSDGYAPILGRELVTGLKGDNQISVVHNISCRFTDSAAAGKNYCVVTIETMNRKIDARGNEVRTHAGTTRHIPAYELVATMYPEYSNEREIKEWRDSMADVCAKDKATHEAQIALTASRFAASIAPPVVRIQSTTAPQV